MPYNIATDAAASQPVRTDISSWLSQYKEQHIETSHDTTMLSLATGDESLVVVGPPRLSGEASEFYVVGMLTNLQYSESAQVTPTKAIGSRRHIFARSNAPISGNIERMVFLGPNLARALYALTSVSTKFSDRNSKYANGQSWYMNLEEDIFRIPIGLGVIYGSPATAMDGGNTVVGAEYLESCVINSRNVSLAPGQPMIMESVSFLADRAVPWEAYTTVDFNPNTYDNPTGKLVR